MSSTELTRYVARSLEWGEDNRPLPHSLARFGPGVQWWEGLPGDLRVRVKQAEARGEIQRLTEIYPVAGRSRGHQVRGLVIRQLKPPRPRWIKPTLIATGVAVPVVGAAVLAYAIATALWSARTTIASVAALVVLAWLLLKGLAGHRTTCPGLHCSGCRG